MATNLIVFCHENDNPLQSAGRAGAGRRMRREEAVHGQTIGGCFPVELGGARSGETSAAAGDATLAQDAASRRVYAGETARAIQNHDYIGAMSRLQTLQRQANLSVPQRIAVQEAMESVQTKLVLEGAKGDARARQAAEEIRRNVQHQ
jgi:hypothetical protein